MVPWQPFTQPSHSKSLLKIVVFTFVILKSHTFFCYFSCDFNDVSNCFVVFKVISLWVCDLCLWFSLFQGRRENKTISNFPLVARLIRISSWRIIGWATCGRLLHHIWRSFSNQTKYYLWCVLEVIKSKSFGLLKERTVCHSVSLKTQPASIHCTTVWKREVPCKQQTTRVTQTSDN